MCECMWRSEDNFLSLSSHSTLSREGLPCFCLLHTPGQPALSSRDSAVFVLHFLKGWLSFQTGTLYMWALGVELGPPNLHSSPSFPAPILFFETLSLIAQAGLKLIKVSCLGVPGLWDYKGVARVFLCPLPPSRFSTTDPLFPILNILDE